MTVARPAGLRVAAGDQMPSVGLRATDGYLLNLRTFVGKQPSVVVFFAGPSLHGARREEGDAMARALADAYPRLQRSGIGLVAAEIIVKRYLVHLFERRLARHYGVLEAAPGLPQRRAAIEDRAVASRMRYVGSERVADRREREHAVIGLREDARPGQHPHHAIE